MCWEYLHSLTIGQNHLTQSLFYNKLLDSSCNLLNTLLAVKKELVIGVQNDCQPIYQLLVLGVPWCLESPGSLPQPASRERIVLQITSPGKDPNSKSEVWFLFNVYCFHKIIKSSHHKSRNSSSWYIWSI